MNVAVFGLGYVGCVTAGCLARAGHRVVGVDVVAEKAAAIAAGTPTVIEPGLKELIAEVVSDGRLSATTVAEEALSHSDVALVCVGTPSGAGGHPDLSGLIRVANDIAYCLARRERPLTVVLRSTVLPGTSERFVARVLGERVGGEVERFSIAFNPEFMREGSSLDDFEHPPFVIVGCDNEATADLLRRLYAGVDGPFLRTTIRTAEMVKYVCNAFHALKICFSNEMADLCDVLGADAQEVMRIFRLDRKLNISDAYLKPGFAFGGSCLPKDVRALESVARVHNLPLPLLSSIMSANENQVLRNFQAVLAAGKRRIGIVGLAFKPGIDDLRESPMVALVERLIGKGYDVRVLDSAVSLTRLVGANRWYLESELPHIASLLCNDVQELIAHAELLIVTAASEEGIRAARLARRGQTIVDLTRGSVPGLEKQPIGAEECVAR